MPSPRLPGFLRSVLKKACERCDKGPTLSLESGSPQDYERRVKVWVATWVTGPLSSITRDGGRKQDIALLDILERKLPEHIRDDLTLALAHLRTGPVLSAEDATSPASAGLAVSRWLLRDVTPPLRRCLAWAEGAQSSV